MDLGSEIAGVLRDVGEEITLRKEVGGSFNTTTQAWTAGSQRYLATYGRLRSVTQGVDGMTIKRGDLEAWLPRRPLAAAAWVPAVGDVLIREGNSEELRILEVSDEPVAGFYRCRARGVSS